MSNGGGRSTSKVRVFTYDLHPIVEEYELPDSWKPVNAILEDEKLIVIATKYEVRRKGPAPKSLAELYPDMVSK